MNSNEIWIQLFNLIPVSLQDSIALGLTTGAEIVIQRIVKLDPEFMIVRGRLAGTNDTGRIVMIPYLKLTFVAIQRDLKDAEVTAIFGEGATPNMHDIRPVAAESTLEPTSAPAAPEAATVNEPAPTVNPLPAVPPAAPARPSVFDRVRKRQMDAEKK